MINVHQKMMVRILFSIKSIQVKFRISLEVFFTWITEFKKISFVKTRMKCYFKSDKNIFISLCFLHRIKKKLWTFQKISQRLLPWRTKLSRNSWLLNFKISENFESFVIFSLISRLISKVTAILDKFFLW